VQQQLAFAARTTVAGSATGCGVQLTAPGRCYVT
jgi:hypothetical protein